MTEGLQAATEVVGANAGPHADETVRQAKYPLASYFALAHSMTGINGPSAEGIGAAAR